jgi:hypothetical protein
MSDGEREALQRSADTLKSALARMDLTRPERECRCARFFTNFDLNLLGTPCDSPHVGPMRIVGDPIIPAVETACIGQHNIKVNRPGDAPPRTGSTGGRSSHQDRSHSGAVGRKSPKMAREPQALISTSLAAASPDRRRTERLSLRAAIFWIGVLSLAGWSAIIVLALALF